MNRNVKFIRNSATVALPPAGRQPALEPLDSGEQPFWRRGLAGVLFRNKLLVIGSAALGLLAGVAAVLLTPPVYRARTSLQLEGFNESFLQHATPITPLLENAPVDSYVRNQLSSRRARRTPRRKVEPQPRWRSVPRLRKLISRSAAFVMR